MVSSILVGNRDRRHGTHTRQPHTMTVYSGGFQAHPWQCANMNIMYNHDLTLIFNLHMYMQGIYLLTRKEVACHKMPLGSDI